ncbi:hypothetical protein [Rhodanobacter denitrificans]|uniref:hypothetical protein n=1 Tax=Rhodanobacter denitrificans TaxID=666685 RepID=UPI001F466D78|nr:hypothetical protein [Rhodanobacter denitrificans]UJJ60512.1 hypothetical protein LRK55_18945 [Rhodanobacter denitrificans]
MSALPRSESRFLPDSALDYSRRAKHLAWVIQRPLQEAQELLAKAYGYADAHELRALLQRTLEVAESTTEDPLTEASRRMQQGFTVENRLLHLLAGGDEPTVLARLSSREWLARDIGLTNVWPWHKREFARVKASILVEEAAEPRDLLGATPLDYGRAYRTSAGDYTIALTAAGQAVKDVLSRWYEQQDGVARPPREHAARLAALRARHPANPWLHADRVLGMGYDLAVAGDHESDGWVDVLAEARITIGMFERILSVEQAASYAGAKLVSSGMGFGNEAYSYPSVLYYAGVAARNSGHLAEAIGHLERGYMMDTRDGAGTRFALLDAYARRARRAQPAASWDELTFGHVLRAVGHFEAGDSEGAVESFAYALVERLWQQFNNGYEHASRSLAGLLKAAAPVAGAHPAAWHMLAAIADDAAAKAAVKAFTAEALRFQIVDLEPDAQALAEKLMPVLERVDYA